MSTVIIYPSDEPNRIVVVYPALNDGLTLETIAKKDVPAGKPYRFVPFLDLPDYTFFDAFEADFSEPDGYGADYGVGTDWAVISWNGQTPTVCKILKDEYGAESLDFSTAHVHGE